MHLSWSLIHVYDTKTYRFGACNPCIFYSSADKSSTNAYRTCSEIMGTAVLGKGRSLHGVRTLGWSWLGPKARS